MSTLEWVLTQCDWCAYFKKKKKGNLDTETDTEGECHVKMKAEFKMKPFQIRVPASHQKLGRGMEQILPHRLRRNQTCGYLGLGLRLLAFRTVKQYISIV